MSPRRRRGLEGDCRRQSPAEGGGWGLESPPKAGIPDPQSGTVCVLVNNLPFRFGTAQQVPTASRVLLWPVVAGRGAQKTGGMLDLDGGARRPGSFFFGLSARVERVIVCLAHAERPKKIRRSGVHRRPNGACHVFSVSLGHAQPAAEGPVRPSASPLTFRIGKGGYPALLYK